MRSTAKLSLICLLVLAAASLSSLQAAEQHGMVMFEDLWPSNGDLDFNDEVIQYNVSATPDSNGKVTGIRATYNVLAIGSSIHNGLYLHLPTPSNAISSVTVDVGGGPVTTNPVVGESQLVIPLVADTRELFPAASGFINTESGLPPVQATSPIQVDVQFASPVDLDLSQTPFDLFIARTGNFGHQIHQSHYPGTDAMNVSLFNTGNDASSSGRWFVNTNGIPFALTIPTLIDWPREGASIDVAYPQILDFAASNGTLATDWYNFPNPQYLYSTVPEPTTLALAGLGLLCLGFATLQKKYRRV